MEEAKKVGGMIARARFKYIFCVPRNIFFIIVTIICWGIFIVCNAVHYKLFIAFRCVLYVAILVILIIYLVRIYYYAINHNKSDISVVRALCYKHTVCLSKRDTSKLLAFPQKWTYLTLNIIGGILIPFSFACIISQIWLSIDKLLQIENATWLCYWMLALAVFILSTADNLYDLSHIHESARKYGYYEMYEIEQCRCILCGRMFTEKKVGSSFRTVTERKKSEDIFWESTEGYIGEGEYRIPIKKTHYMSGHEYDETYAMEDIVMECQACGNRRTVSKEKYN